MNTVEQAEMVAILAHKGQVDKAGVPYIEHPRFVAALCKTEEEKIVAFLHDTVEDTEVTIGFIEKTFGEKIAEAVNLLTHQKDVPYFDYIKSLGANPLARAVKIADLTHNMDISRISSPQEKDYKRIEKYKEAYKMLKNRYTYFSPKISGDYLRLDKETGELYGSTEKKGEWVLLPKSSPYWDILYDEDEMDISSEDAYLNDPLIK